jgi:riboflavin synthase
VFSGIIEEIGTVASSVKAKDGLDLTLILPREYLTEVQLGDSVAVNGACLTCANVANEKICFNLSPETLSLTNLSGLALGQKVNVERALKLGDRINGHLVSGHVDDVAEVLSITREGECHCLIISKPLSCSTQIIKKGSITLDGVSLTTNESSGESFRVMIVPYTFTNTIIENYNVGTKVNIEIDLMARYVQGMMKL